MNILSISDLELILESLKYTKIAFEEYDKYPTADYKLKRIDDVNKTISKIKTLKKEF